MRGARVTTTTATISSRWAALLIIFTLALASPLACILQCHLFPWNASTHVIGDVHFVCPLNSDDHHPSTPAPHAPIQALYELLPVTDALLPALLLAGLLAATPPAVPPQPARTPLVPPPRSA